MCMFPFYPKLLTFMTQKLRECCTNFASTFPFHGSPNVDLNYLILDLRFLQLTLRDKPITAMKISEYVRKVDYYPNDSIAYRFLFVMAVTVASAERTFSKLKLLKIFEGSISQERLNVLAIL